MKKNRIKYLFGLVGVKMEPCKDWGCLGEGRGRFWRLRDEDGVWVCDCSEPVCYFDRWANSRAGTFQPSFECKAAFLESFKTFWDRMKSRPLKNGIYRCPSSDDDVIFNCHGKGTWVPRESSDEDVGFDPNKTVCAVQFDLPHVCDVFFPYIHKRMIESIIRKKHKNMVELEMDEDVDWFHRAKIILKLKEKYLGKAAIPFEYYPDAGLFDNFFRSKLWYDKRKKRGEKDLFRDCLLRMGKFYKKFKGNER